MTTESIKFDRAVDFYDQTRGFPPGVELDVAALIARLGGFTRSSRTLEIGVGTGRIALPLSAHVGAIFGVDLSRPMMERLRAKQHGEPITLAEADATHLPFRAGSFDGAVAVHVFHLIPTWREVLGEVARVLKPGAPLINAHNIHTLDHIWNKLRERGEMVDIARPGVQDSEQDTFLTDAGWKPLGEAVETRWEKPFRPADLVESITNRSGSMTWDMSDAQLEQYAATVRRGLSEEFADLAAEYMLPHGFMARAFLPPGSQADQKP